MPASPLSGRKVVDAAQSLRVRDHRDRYAVFDYLRRDVIHDLMCNFHVEFAAIEARHGIEFQEYFSEDLAVLAEHEADGMVEVDTQAIRVTPVGELFVRNLAMCFDRYLRDKRDPEKPVFSRTV